MFLTLRENEQTFSSSPFQLTEMNVIMLSKQTAWLYDGINQSIKTILVKVNSDLIVIQSNGQLLVFFLSYIE